MPEPLHLTQDEEYIQDCTRSWMDLQRAYFAARFERQDLAEASAIHERQRFIEADLWAAGAVIRDRVGH